MPCFLKRLLCVSLLLSSVALPLNAALDQSVSQNELPATPVDPSQAFAAALGDTLVLVDPKDGSVYALPKDAPTWTNLGSVSLSESFGTATTNDNDLLIVSGTQVTKLSLDGSQIKTEQLAPLPRALASPAATVSGGNLYLYDADSFLSLNLADPTSAWTTLPLPQSEARSHAFLVKSVETLSLIGGRFTNGDAAPQALSYHSRYAWSQAETFAPEGTITSAAKLGDAHAIATILSPSGSSAVYLYHTIGDSWIELSTDHLDLPSDTQVLTNGNAIYLLSQSNSLQLSIGEPDTNYGWWDHLSVGLYFLIMLWIGFHFAKQSKNTEDFFRGGHKIPWWATGMSLFATGASAMSLMAMPGKSYAGNWTFFAISIYSVLCLPISMYLYAPIVRKMNFGTAFEYLEKRFGLSVRIIGSAIFAVYQILGRMGGVLLLPSFALEAIAGIPMSVSVPIMGVVTIAYTFLGGLSAVIWTDTIQGFVMIAAVAGCLILVLFRIEMPMSEIFTTLDAQSKLHLWDWGFSLTDENVFTVFIGIVAVTALGIGDQNYVQRVQCGNSLKSTKKAIATQMGVAVPINLLLFALGTALFLFYKQHPQDLNPVMRNDGIYPFFAAQQLPPGVSGLVIAALLAATMSTISSSICSVSNLAVDDFYKRFSKNPSDAKAVNVGRVVTVLVGLFGIASAFYLDSFETPSIWDLALRVVSIVTATTVGIYALGLLSKRANEIGVLAGIFCGMAITFWISDQKLIIFWLYPVVGSFVTYGVGYAVSIATGGNRKDLAGLTLATLHQGPRGLDD